MRSVGKGDAFHKALVVVEPTPSVTYAGQGGTRRGERSRGGKIGRGGSKPATPVAGSYVNIRNTVLSPVIQSSTHSNGKNIERGGSKPATPVLGSSANTVVQSSTSSSKGARGDGKPAISVSAASVNTNVQGRKPQHRGENRRGGSRPASRSSANTGSHGVRQLRV